MVFYPSISIVIINLYGYLLKGTVCQQSTRLNTCTLLKIYKMHLLSLYIRFYCSIGLSFSLLSRKYTPKYLHIAALFPVTPSDSPEGQTGLRVIPAVELALEHVNSHPRILPGIKLHLTRSEVSRSNKDNACDSIFETCEILL